MIKLLFLTNFLKEYELVKIEIFIG